MKTSERLIVSAHVDGEVEAPWTERVQDRLDHDPAWAGEAARHRAVRSALAAAPEPDWTAANARVRDALERHRTVPSPGPRFPLVWTLAAAAALVVVATGTGFWLGRQSAVGAASEVAELQVQVPKNLGLKLSGEGQLIMASTLGETVP